MRTLASHDARSASKERGKGSSLVDMNEVGEEPNHKYCIVNIIIVESRMNLSLYCIVSCLGQMLLCLPGIVALLLMYHVWVDILCLPGISDIKT